ncbi:Gfo/Idh/MocA family oxidoreductase [Bifidobacterium amazonense]|uniref:Gfo/Idh/MocA family oxidoreductase n=1 Tax=Bifidobacterium amazonense TaxID=2809027 RepID=A0ABS9VU04_9BIFI|nr:Gfo/Idh/MocA family oxidoreductase [Bifidobacterium amazonense]MCH9275558.1 Gfo/Idh/MocA family oxidoreductase [Bifidobacterium amazonense]MCH9275567.1 Gfo/Idh/MocA family oxidoreductase [Bifidobacterium amazonense]
MGVTGNATGRLNGRQAEAEAQGLKVNVAILGAGRIAIHMAETLTKMAADERYRDLITPYAVAARDADRAAAFAAQHGFPVSYGSYEELLADPNVDLVYIATPHSLHAEQGIACLEAGKNILVEKSFTANAAQARSLLDAADRTGLLCTEAIWTRYMPSRALIDDVVASGRIGEVRAINANLCYPVTGKPRMTDPALAGGALLDVGVYPLNFIDMVMGGDGSVPVERIATSMMPYETGVDAQNSATLYYAGGAGGVMATAVSSMLCASDRDGVIWGTDGYVVCRNINNVEAIDVYGPDHALRERIDVPAQLTGYEYEVAAAANAILDGRGECAEMPHADTLRIMELMDALRDRWGLRYPFE